jgi:hypothetical protein
MRGRIMPNGTVQEIVTMHALLASVGIIAIIVVTFAKLNLRTVPLKRSARPGAHRRRL